METLAKLETRAELAQFFEPDRISAFCVQAKKKSTKTKCWQKLPSFVRASSCCSTAADTHEADEHSQAASSRVCLDPQNTKLIAKQKPGGK